MLEGGGSFSPLGILVNPRVPQPQVPIESTVHCSMGACQILPLFEISNECGLTSMCVCIEGLLLSICEFWYMVKILGCLYRGNVFFMGIFIVCISLMYRAFAGSGCSSLPGTPDSLCTQLWHPIRPCTPVLLPWEH